MRHALTISALAGLIGPAFAGVIVLDDFASDPNTGLAGPRSVSSVMIANPFNQPATFEVDTAFSYNGNVGAAIFNSGIGASQQGRITWNNDGVGLDLDLVAMHGIGFQLDFLMVDLDFRVDMVLRTNDGGSAEHTQIISAGGAQTYTFDLADFTTNAGFDPADVDGIELWFNPRTDNIASLDFILTEVRMLVPSPGSAGLLAAAGLFALRRRR